MLDGSHEVRPTSGRRTEPGEDRPRRLARHAAIAGAVALVIAAAMAAAMAPVAAAQPTQAAPQVIAGPGAGVSIGGLLVARDGTGGLVYLEQVDGVEHVFASRLIGGVFEPPTQIDSGLASDSSQPVITGTNGGILQVAFVNAGNLYVTGTGSTTEGWTAPQAIAPAASNPSIQMNTFGEAYLAFTQAVGGGDDVDVEYFDDGTWTPVSPEAMNVTANDDAGTGAGRPVIAAAGDGVAIVAWGEHGHVYSRRVWGTMASVEGEQLDPPTYAGWSERTADSPAVAVGGDSSYPDIAFREDFSDGGQTQSRVLLARLVAEDIDPAVAVDGLASGDQEMGVEPAVSMNEYGRGFATAATELADNLIAAPLSTNGVPGSPYEIAGGSPYEIAEGSASEIAGGVDSGLPYAVPASAGLISTLIAWQQTSASSSSQIAVRYAQDGADLAPAEILSTPAAGNTVAADGLAAGGDNAGDAAVAWVQSEGALLTVDAAQLYQPPGQPTPSSSRQYTTNVHPTLSWSASHEDWGPLTYRVTLDGSTLGETTGGSLPVAATLTDGPHLWQVTATNPAGVTSTSNTATVFVDTQPPRLRIQLGGIARVGSPVVIHVSYLDPPNPTEPGAEASGVATVTVGWGRGAPRALPVSATGSGAQTHRFTRAGLYLVSVTATDRAGNATKIVRYLHVLPAR